MASPSIRSISSSFSYHAECEIDLTDDALAYSLSNWESVENSSSDGSLPSRCSSDREFDAATSFNSSEWEIELPGDSLSLLPFSFEGVEPFPINPRTLLLDLRSMTHLSASRLSGGLSTEASLSASIFPCETSFIPRELRSLQSLTVTNGKMDEAFEMTERRLAILNKVKCIGYLEEVERITTSEITKFKQLISEGALRSLVSQDQASSVIAAFVEVRRSYRLAEDSPYGDLKLYNEAMKGCNKAYADFSYDP